MTVDAAVAAEQTAAAPVAQAPGFWRRWRRKPLGVISAAYLVLITVLCLAAALLAPYDALEQDLQNVGRRPRPTTCSARHRWERCLSRLMFGGQITLLGVFEAVLVLLIISVPIGLVAGYVGGWFDRMTSATLDLVLALPTIIIVLAVLAVFGTSMTSAMITLGVGLAGVIRVIRGAVLSVREELYVAAARVSGATGRQILGRPSCSRVAGPASFRPRCSPHRARGETGLAFLSLGITLPAPSWGGMVGEAADVIEQFPWLLVPSGAIIALTILAFGLRLVGTR